VYPHLLPTDVSGVSVFNQKTTEFEFRPGPLFAQTVLADEINRTTPRTQSALLEAMAERRVTVDGQTYTLKPPFLIIATQNPIDHEGTFPLPEAQLDRFLLRLSLGYPVAGGRREDAPAAAAVASDRRSGLGRQCGRRPRLPGSRPRGPHRRQGPPLSASRLSRRRAEHNEVLLGGSPRASIALFRTAQALAIVSGETCPARRHQKDGNAGAGASGHPAPESRLRRITVAAVLREILDEISVPCHRRTATIEPGISSLTHPSSVMILPQRTQSF